ncbi:MAG TPA: Calx-beta domain-containing protein [Verrucomicrobiae bacterium]|nr:Calx-beta domain-containing protein [Verrucomicrobiae bacterium]
MQTASASGYVSLRRARSSPAHRLARTTLLGAVSLLTGLALTAMPGQAHAQAGTFSFSQSAYTNTVSQTNAVISVILTGSPPVPVSVDFATHDGTATAGVDYVATTGTLAYAVGVFSNTFKVPLLNNGIAQSTQTVNLALSNPSPLASLGFPSNAVLTIINTSSQVVQFAQSAYTVDQGESNAVVTIVRTGGSSTTGTVFFTTSDGTAKAGIDYTATSATVTFTNGLSTNAVAIPLLPGSPLSTNQTVNLKLSNPTGMVLGSHSNAVLTIVATGPTVLQFSRPSYNFHEHAGKAKLTVIRFGSSAAGASVNFATSDGTAVDGVDYHGTSGTLVFPSGTETANISFRFVEFNSFQSNKTVVATLSDPIGGSLGTQATALVTIVNDRPQTVIFTNSADAVATLRLVRAGTMDVPPGNLPSNIVFSATDAGSVLTINVKKGTNGSSFVQIGGFSGDGGLRMIHAPNVDLTGSGVQLGGFVRQLQFHDVLNGAAIAIGGSATDQTKIVAHNIDDGAAITTTCRIASLQAARVGDVAITAPSIGSLTIHGDKRNGLTGDFNGQIELTGDGVAPGGPTLRKFTASGTISNASIDVATGNLLSIVAPAILDSSIYVGFIPTHPDAPLLGGTFVSDLQLKSVTVNSSASGYANSVIASPEIGTVSLRSVRTDNSGVPFGVVANQSIKSVTSKTPPFKWNKAGAPDQSLGDFHVILP